MDRKWVESRKLGKEEGQGRKFEELEGMGGGKVE